MLRPARAHRLGAVALLIALAACSGGERVTVATTRLTLTTPTAAPSETKLQPALDAAVRGARVPISAVVVTLATGERAEHLADRVVLSASLYKLFVARELYRRNDVDDCVRKMIVISDDACGVAGLNKVGRGALDASLHRDGFTGTSLATPQRTTAADVAELLRRERAGNTALYALLKQQQVNDRVPPALPAGTPFAHKTGDRTGWAHDAGVITTPKGDLLVVLLTGPWPSPCCHEERIGRLEREAFALIGSVARRVYDASVS